MIDLHDLKPHQITGIECGRCERSYDPVGVKVVLPVFSNSLDEGLVRKIEFDHPFCEACSKEFQQWWRKG